MPINIWPLWRSVIGRDTFSVLAAVLGPQQKWLCHPLPLFMAVSMMLSMWYSSRYCMRHSWRTHFGAISLNQLEIGISHFVRNSRHELLVLYVSPMLYLHCLRLVSSLFASEAWSPKIIKRRYLPGQSNYHAWCVISVSKLLQAWKREGHGWHICISNTGWYPCLCWFYYYCVCHPNV